MTQPKIYNTVYTQLRDHMGGDAAIVAAARASVDDWTEVIDMAKKSNIGLINYLMREKHGSPFEHNSMTFWVKAPIFVFREIHRHRMASYNEMSGRYTELPGEFYIPAPERNMINVGSSAKPEMAPGDHHQYMVVRDAHMKAYEVCWEQYNRMLDVGIANEVARSVLPVGIYSQMVMTINLRSAFNFLSLRTQVESAAHLSRPQREIEMVAEQIEEEIARLFPVAYRMFNNHGRVAP